MGNDRSRIKSDPQFVRAEVGTLIAPEQFASLIENMVPNDEGALETISGPTPWLLAEGGALYGYGATHGIHYASLMGGSRECLLIHDGNNIREFDGAGRVWNKLVSAGGGQFYDKLPDNRNAQFPCQFEDTPNGVVIVPQGGRAYIYDGDIILPLGYDKAPSPPRGHGPETLPSGGASANLTKAGTDGYAIRRSKAGSTLAIIVSKDFGYGRVGTINPTVYAYVSAGQTPGILKDAYQGALQWINRFGDVSPLSPRSNSVEMDTAACSSVGDTPEGLLCWLLWTDLSLGPKGTAGRILSRTKSLEHSGTTQLFNVPNDFGVGGSGSFASIPDNVCETYSDNVPNSWLLTPAIDPMPVPIFKLCKMAFGRLWIANAQNDPGLLIPSMIGRYGTFLKGTERFPDPRGGEITGLWFVNNLLIVTTISSTYAIRQSDDGLNFVEFTLHPTLGCVAPSSMKSLDDGSTVWLSAQGFVHLGPEGLKLLSTGTAYDHNKINWTRARQACAVFDEQFQEYRCWVPWQGGRENEMCFVYDKMADGFRRRTDVVASGVCSIKDGGRYTVTCGKTLRSDGVLCNGVWVLDHETADWSPATKTAKIETVWLGSATSMDRKSPKHMLLFMRETQNVTDLTIDLHRDWKRKSTPAMTTSVESYDIADPPDVWDTAAWDEADLEWRRRRPYWRQVDLFAPSSSVIKLALSCAGSIEYFGFTLLEQPQPGTGRME